MPTRRASRPSIEPIAGSSKKAVAVLKFTTSASVNDTISLSSTDGTTKTYLAITGSSQHHPTVENNDGDISRPELGTYILFRTGSANNDSSSAANVASHLKRAITHVNGHGDKFLVYVNEQTVDSFNSTLGQNANISDLYTGSGAVHIYQNKEGVTGNKKVTHTLSTVTGSVVDFKGGKDMQFEKVHNNI